MTLRSVVKASALALFLTVGTAHANDTPSDAAAAVVVHTFETQEEMQECVKLVQQKQAALSRIAVLEEYLLRERAAVEQLDGQLLLKFQIHPAGSYSLDETNRRIMSEQVPPPTR